MPKYAWVRDHAGNKYKSKEIYEVPTVHKALKLDL